MKTRLFNNNDIGSNRDGITRRIYFNHRALRDASQSACDAPQWRQGLVMQWRQLQLIYLHAAVLRDGRRVMVRLRRLVGWVRDSGRGGGGGGGGAWGGDSSGTQVLRRSGAQALRRSGAHALRRSGAHLCRRIARRLGIRSVPLRSV